MDSRNNFIEKFRARLPEIDETLLISLANRGIYKRSVKDLETGSVPQINIGEESLEAHFEDDAVSCFTSEFESATCSCPSKKYCRHRILTLLYIVENENELFGDTGGAVETVFDNSKFLSLPVNELLDKISEKDLESILFRFDFGLEIDIKEQNRLIISFPDENCVTSFAAEEPLISSNCSSCRDEEFCVHRAEALIHYLIQHGKLTFEELKEQEKFTSIEIPLLQIKSLLTDIIERGLARLPESIINSLEQEAIICKNHQIPEIESRLRTIQKMISDYFSGSVTFSARDLRNRICSLSNRIDAVNRGSSTSRKARSFYGTVPPLTLHAAGAEKWASASYAGITFYFFSPELNRWFTFSQSRPTYYGTAPIEAEYNSVTVGEQFFSTQQFSTSEIRFRNLKVNHDYRISSSSETKAVIFRDSSLLTTAANFTSWPELFNSVREWFSEETDERTPNGNLAVITPVSYGDISFDEINQRYRMELRDQEDRTLAVTVQHSENSKAMVANLKTLSQNKPAGALFGKLSLYNSELIFFPISFTGESTVNLTFEEL